ncbi:MAG: GNAT family N-acetyltransferase [Ilumatobacteraceae bacterium]
MSSRERSTASATPRLEIRLPTEQDRERFVALFCDGDFMQYSAGVLDVDAAHRRFDEMLVRAAELSFAKQPVIERLSGDIVGYVGVNRFEFDGQQRLEFGYRLIPEARGKGYATEAGRLVLERAAETFGGEMLAMIDPTNSASQNVAEKLGFVFWKQAMIDGAVSNLYRLTITPRLADPTSTVPGPQGSRGRCSSVVDEAGPGPLRNS